MLIKNYNQCELRMRCWIIMSKDRAIIAKGTPKKKCLLHIEERTKQRVLIYSSKGKAEAAIKGIFYCSERTIEHGKKKFGAAMGKNYRKSELEAVPSREIIEYDYKGMI